MKYSNAVMEIPSFQQDDAGGYECVAENKMGKNTAAGRLAFYGTVPSFWPVWKTVSDRNSTDMWKKINVLKKQNT